MQITGSTRNGKGVCPSPDAFWLRLSVMKVNLLDPYATLWGKEVIMKKALSVFGRAFFCALALVFVSAFVSCKESDDDEGEVIAELSEFPSSLKGTWKSSGGDSYVISETAFENYMYDGAEASYSLNYKGGAEVEGAAEPTYYLWYQSPETYTYSMTYGTDTYEGTYYTENYYTAVRVIVKSETVLDVSCACDASYKTEDPDFATVKSTFRIGNGFFPSNVEYTKVAID